MAETSGIIKRIEHLCIDHKTTIGHLEKKFGYSNGSIRKSKNLQSDRLYQIANYFGVSMEYLVTGEEDNKDWNKGAVAGEILQNMDLFNLVIDFKALSDDDQALVKEIIHRLKNK